MATQAINPALATPSIDASRTRLWGGRILFAIPVVFLLMDGVMKLVNPPQVAEAMQPLGWANDMARPLGVLLLACVAVYAVPRTAVLGAVLLTGYFGGAIATNLRVGNPLLTHVLFPVYLAVMIWGALYLRDARVRSLLAPRER